MEGFRLCLDRTRMGSPEETHTIGTSGREASRRRRTNPMLRAAQGLYVEIWIDVEVRRCQKTEQIFGCIQYAHECYVSFIAAIVENESSADLELALSNFTYSLKQPHWPNATGRCLTTKI
jgi:hypothetical protein